MNGYTLIDSGNGKLGAKKVDQNSKRAVEARWVVNELTVDERVMSAGGTRFNVTNWGTKEVFENWTIGWEGANMTYGVMEGGMYLSMMGNGTVGKSKDNCGPGWEVFSVSYS
jgi:hypothetical protein